MSKPIKSRHGLTRCASCRAHIEAAERPSLTDCPFCGANLYEGGPRMKISGRGGLIAGALMAFSVTACGGGDDAASGDDTTQEPTTGGDDGTASDDTSDDPAGDDTYADDPADDNTAVAEYGIPADDYEEAEAEDPAPAPRYGMAPPR